MNVLILTGKFGMGHYTAAKSLLEQIKHECSDVNVSVIDLLDYTMPTYANKIYEAFSLMVSHAGVIYNAVYMYLEKTKSTMKIPLLDYIINNLDKLIDEIKPDIIISTAPLCSRVVSQYKDIYQCGIPLITCITDVSCHPEWHFYESDYYFVANDSVKNMLTVCGIPGKIVFVIGIPVKREFKKKKGYRNASCRHILIMGGGLGILPRSASFYEAINSLANLKTTIITGHNQRLYKKLYGKYENIEVIGYTDKVYEYMHAADLVISKPGGITMYETIFAELPIMAFKPSLRQELKNSDFILNNNIGRVLPKHPIDCARVIADFVHDEEAQGRIRNNIKVLKSQIDQISICELLFAIQKNMICA